jgi:cyclophilin family peptidyl-prolyl cis-trans isomerase
MWHLILPMLVQDPVTRPVLEAEHARAAGVQALIPMARTGPVSARVTAIRALGRLEDTTWRAVVASQTTSPTPAVRVAAFGALAQMRATHGYATALASERNASVRGAIHEALGRARPLPSDAESLLAAGLADAAPAARHGAVRGLESLIRLNRRTVTPTAATITALQRAFASDTSEPFRVMVLLSLNAIAATDSATRAIALRDRSPQVRRLGVMSGNRWVSDPSPLVRTEAVRFVNDCSQLQTLTADSSDHVALAAIARLGRRSCPAAMLLPPADGGRTWRHRAAALEALVRADSSRALVHVRRLAADSIWQVRARAGAAATALRDTITMATLAADGNPNVALTALRTAGDLQRAMRSTHAGLVLAAAEQLKGSPLAPALLPDMLTAFGRLTGEGRMTMRDPRVALLQRIGESTAPESDAVLRAALADHDPAVAAVAASALSTRTGATVMPTTRTLPIPPLPSASYIAGLRGATARITMRGLGTMVVQLLPDEAPVTVATFAQLAESGQFDGLTFHRIVPNFVIQGGSPGADEYDGRTADFMRDELGLARNVRGSIGISTRGRDTGDGQIYFNLVDNVRLDRDYTVLATMRSGLDVMDRVQEGDVIERIEIIRRTSPAGRARR